ncbi:Putative response regulator [Magnetospirillum sp. XM-1]|uniref:response regulator n=1 Tax=Magnetospirillum sp. XM-1 TaxID=1663591 RepID=UPI00073DDC9A|nr:response regulator [Magnetospirillum sp. XM-1]CUW39948.1 Putative response regulator [Magnetospirillum sp. XM-1]
MRHLKVLIVEDNVADARLQQFALGAQVFDCAVTWVDSIDGAVEHFNRRIEETGGADTDVVLLDGMVGSEDASELLIYMKLDPLLKDVPVVVTTGSRDPRRHEAWITQGAESVMQKCFEIEDLESGLSALEAYARDVA